MASLNEYQVNGIKHYYVAYRYKDRSGRIKQSVKRGFKTKTAARDFQRDVEEKLKTGTVRHDPRMTLSQLLDEWSKEYLDKRLALGKLKQNTYNGYTVNIRHLKEGLGHVKIKDITSELIEDFYITKLETGNLATGGPLAPRSIQYIHRNFSAALSYAVKKKYLNSNPCLTAEMVAIEKRFVRICTSEEFDALLIDTAGTELEIPVLLALSFGMRRGEILGLRWSDVAFDRNMIHINGQLAQTPSGIAITSPKSATSKRPLPLVPRVSKALKAHKFLQDQLKQEESSSYANHDLICCHANGTPILPDYFSQAFRRFTDLHHFSHLRFHDLRHTFASLALSNGVPMAVVSSLLGHSSISITVDIYGHITDDAKSSAVEIVFDAISSLATIYTQNNLTASDLEQKK